VPVRAPGEPPAPGLSCMEQTGDIELDIMKKTRRRVVHTLVRDARARASLSQRELARRARTPQCAVTRIERGQTDPGMRTLERLINSAGFDLRLSIEPRAVLDRQVLDDVPRILRLTPEDRLREIASLSRFLAAARPSAPRG